MSDEVYLGTLKEDTKSYVRHQHEGLLDEEEMFPSLRSPQSQGTSTPSFSLSVQHPPHAHFMLAMKGATE